MLELEIDGFFNSIKRVSDGATVATQIVQWSDLLPRQVSSLSTWLFRWNEEAIQPDKQIFALFALGSPHIQGMMSLQEMEDHIFVHLIESAPQNRGNEKVFEGVPGNLIAFAALRSRLLGMQGVIALDAKTELIGHYKRTLGASQVGRSSRMIIGTEASARLIDQTFRGSDQWPV